MKRFSLALLLCTVSAAGLPLRPAVAQVTPAPPTPAAPETAAPVPAPAPADPGSSVPPTSPSPQAPPAPPPSPRVLVGEVVVDGVEGALEDEVYGAIRTRPGFTTTREQIQADIDAIFATGFFRNVRAVPEDTPLGVRITFIIDPNPVLKGVQVEGAKVLPQEVIDQTFQPLYGQILNFRTLRTSIEQLNTWYKDNKYPLGQVVGSPNIAPDGQVTLEVAEGVIADIQVRHVDADNQPAKPKTRDFIITREMSLKPGDVFNEDQAQKDLQAVFGLGIFEDARLGLEPAPDDPRKAVLLVNVVESRTGQLGGGLGFSTSTGVFGTVSYNERNLGGNNQRLGVNVQVGERDLLFDLSFTDPWIAGDPFRTSYTVNLFNRRSFSFIFSGGDRDVTLPNGDTPRINRLGGSIEFVRPYAPTWVVRAGASYQRVSILDADGVLSPRDEFGNLLAASPSGIDDLFAFNFSGTQDLRDNPGDPTRGSVLRLGMTQTVPLGSGSILFNRVRAGYSYYIPLKFLRFQPNPEVLAINVQAGTILGDLPPYEAFSLGGANSVRGYGEGEVGTGRSFAQATLEYRFPVLSFLRGALFVDYGTTLDTQTAVPGDPGGIREKPGEGLGYGVGVRVVAPFLGNIRVDFGWNDQGGNQLTFGVGERF